VIAQLIAGVDGWIDSYIGKRYAVPLVSPTHRILDLAAEEGARRCRRRRNMPLPDDLGNTELDEKWLKAVANGEVTLGVEPAPEKSELIVDTVGERDSTRNTTRENLKGFW
jgi:phage gp36-like protein